MSDSDDYVLGEIRAWVWSGFYTADQVDQIIDDILDEDTNESLVRAAVRPEFDKKRAAEAGWPESTDCDRLDRVFAELNASGIIAIQNAGYTMSDGHDDVGEVLSQRRREEIKGYCFYHGQDVERAVGGGGLMLAYGDLDADDAGKKEVGTLICAALENAGFAVDWSGEPGKRIFIPDFDWKRRAGNLHSGRKRSWIKTIAQRLMRWSERRAPTRG